MTGGFYFVTGASPPVFDYFNSKMMKTTLCIAAGLVGSALAQVSWQHATQYVAAQDAPALVHGV